VRNLLVALLLLSTPAIAGPNETSNPAFLGVGMNDIGGSCHISTVTKDSGAHYAGVREGDSIVAINGTQITTCDSLVQAIQNHEPGVNVKIEVLRNATRLALEATLPSRADVLRKRFVGKPMPLTTVNGDPIKMVRVEDQAVGDVAVRGKTTIVGLYEQDGCIGCERAFSAINSWARSKGRAGISVHGVTMPSQRKTVPQTAQDLKEMQRRFDVPLFVTEFETFKELSITDNKRIHFLVIDSRGIVCYATPLKPDADDKDAVLGELYAAAEQASRRVK
jgi:membrane-associated protease RseP (regulator of RpoE activity)